MRSIVRMVEQFNKVRVPYIAENFVKSNCHDALIGQWINWWLDDTRGKSSRAIINPGFQVRYRNKKRVADILFTQQEKGIFRIDGVAEVENNQKKIANKIDTLWFHEKAKRYGNLRFPDLKFAILSTYWHVDFEEKDEEYLREYDTIRTATRKIQKISKKSKLTWILFLLNLVPYKKERYIRSKWYENESGFLYKKHFRDSADYVIIRKGEILKKTEIPEI